jgi:hypothetical protein
MSRRGNRLQSSVLTFGPLGRIISSVLVFGVLAWFLMYGGLFGLAGAVVWVGWVMPRALRDIWRRAALPPTDLDKLRAETDRRLRDEERPRAPHPVFDPDADHPTRW